MIKYSPNENPVNCTKCVNGQLLSRKVSNEQNSLLRNSNGVFFIFCCFLHFLNDFLFSLLIQALAL